MKVTVRKFYGTKVIHTYDRMTDFVSTVEQEIWDDQKAYVNVFITRGLKFRAVVREIHSTRDINTEITVGGQDWHKGRKLKEYREYILSECERVLKKLGNNLAENNTLMIEYDHAECEKRLQKAETKAELAEFKTDIEKCIREAVLETVAQGKEVKREDIPKLISIKDLSDVELGVLYEQQKIRDKVYPRVGHTEVGMEILRRAKNERNI